jgi:hypothetical protein
MTDSSARWRSHTRMPENPTSVPQVLAINNAKTLSMLI